MSKLTILHHPNEKLREPSRDVSVERMQDPKIQRLIDDMFETMKAADGVGLAAPQVGQNIRLIVIDSPDGPMAFFNPQIVKKSRREMNSHEGCLSVPGEWGDVARNKRVIVQAEDRTGQDVEISASGLLSIIFQHEIDHLDGILFIDKLWKK